jgi:uncharacterized membrane protein YeaQ/YmgE (transglycosylase-associated protein family)
MVDVAQEVFTYLQDHYLVTFVISLIGGYSAVKTVAHGKRMSPIGFFALGLLGTFLGLFAFRYIGITEVLDLLPQFSFFFDLLAAYVGSFFLASLVHFIRPL